MLKTVTISVIAGTFLLGSYYVIAASYVPPEKQDKLEASLHAVQQGLTYEKLISFDQNQRQSIIQKMPSNTIRLVLDEAREHPSFIAENRDDMKSGSADLRLVNLAQIEGLKGFAADGTASIFDSGDMMFLRLEDFGVVSGIDQRVYLTKDGTVETGIDIGFLKASQGDQNYDITNINTNTYNIAIVYSKPFDIYYAHAKFQNPE